MTTSYLRARRRKARWRSPGMVSPGIIFVPRVALAQVSFDDPPGVLDTGVENLQTWTIKVRKNRDLPTHPILRVELLDARQVVLQTVIDDEPVDQTTPLVFEGTWDAAVLQDTAGKDVEARLTSVNPRGETYVDVAALRWKPRTRPVVRKNISVRWNARSRIAPLPLNVRWNTRSRVAALALNVRWDILPVSSSAVDWSGTTTAFDSTSVTFSDEASNTLDSTAVTMDSTTVTLAN